MKSRSKIALFFSNERHFEICFPKKKTITFSERTYLNYTKNTCGSYIFPSLCQRLGLTLSVRNKPRARSASIECRRRESRPEAKDSRGASLSPEVQEVLRSKTESLNIHIFLCADLECQFKEIIAKK